MAQDIIPLPPPKKNPMEGHRVILHVKLERDLTRFLKHRKNKLTIYLSTDIKIKIQ
jgi:hypothetical protein